MVVEEETAAFLARFGHKVGHGVAAPHAAVEGEAAGVAVELIGGMAGIVAWSVEGDGVGGAERGLWRVDVVPAVAESLGGIESVDCGVAALGGAETFAGAFEGEIAETEMGTRDAVVVGDDHFDLLPLEGGDVDAEGSPVGPDNIATT